MKLFQKILGHSFFCLLALVLLQARTLSAANQQETVSNVYLSNPSPCAGQMVTVYMTLVNTDSPTDGAGTYSIKGALLDSSIGACVTQTTSSNLPNRWWAIGSNTTATTAAPLTNVYSDNGSGYQGTLSTNPVWSTKVVAVPMNIPTTVTPGENLVLELFVNPSYANPTGTGAADTISC